MRSLTLLLLLTVIASAQDVKPVVTLGSTALRGKENVWAVVFSPESDRVGIVEPGSVNFWSLTNGEFFGKNDTEFSATNTRAVASSDGSRIIILYAEGAKTTAHILKADGQGPSIEKKLPDRLDTHFVSENARFMALEKNGDTTIVNLDKPTETHEFPRISNLRRFSASADGRVFAFCNRDGKIDIRAAGAGSWSPPPVEKLQFASIAVSADGRFLAAASFREDEGSGTKTAGPIEIWNIADRKKVATCDAVEWFAEYPNRLRFSPDGKHVFAGDGAYIRGWDTAIGKVVFAVEPGWNYAGPLTISPDGKFIAVAYATRAVVWDVATGKHPKGFEGHPASVWEIVFSPDGTRAATASYGLPQVLVWDPKTGRQVNDFKVPYHTSRTDLKSKQEKTSDTSNEPAKERMEKLINKAEGHTGKDNSATVKGIIPGRIKLALSADGARLATFNEASGSAGPLRVWDTLSRQIRWEKSVDFLQSPEFAFLDAGVLMVPSPQKKIDYYDADGVSRWNRDQIPFIKAAKIDPAGRYVALESLTGLENWIVNAKSGTIDDRIDGVPYAFSPDGSKLIILKLGPTMTDGRFVDLIITRDIAAKKDIGTVSVEMGTLKGRLSPDATVLADEKPGNPKDAFAFRELATKRVISVASRVDTKYIDGNVFGAMQFGEPAAHNPSGAAFSPDGRLFAVTYPNGLLVVWDIASGEELFHTMTGCIAPRFVTFSPDGRTVFTTSGEGAGSPVHGYDCTGGARDDAVPTDKEIPGLILDLKGKPAAARRAIWRLARVPERVVDIAKAITTLPDDAEIKKYDAWIIDLDAAAFRDREAAMKSLADAGWRAEAKLKVALASTQSAEVRERLSDLLDRPDHRRSRVVHLLELTATPEAKALLKEFAAGKDSPTTRDAQAALARLP